MPFRNVRALRPMHVLLVTDDDELAGQFTAVAAEGSVAVDLASPHEDIDELTRFYRPNTVAVDGRRTFRRAARSAMISATLNPQVAVVVFAPEGEGAALGGIPVVDGRQSPERLLQALELARVGAWSTA
jgi:hypothetical protein